MTKFEKGIEEYCKEAGMPKELRPQFKKLVTKITSKAAAASDYVVPGAVGAAGGAGLAALLSLLTGSKHTGRNTVLGGLGGAGLGVGYQASQGDGSTTGTLKKWFGSKKKNLGRVREYVARGRDAANEADVTSAGKQRARETAEANSAIEQKELDGIARGQKQISLERDRARAERSRAIFGALSSDIPDQNADEEVGSLWSSFLNVLKQTGRNAAEGVEG